MTAKEVEQWRHERDLARSISDPSEREEALQKVYDLRDDLQMNCIQHQADRIKTGLANDAILDKDIKQVKRDLDEVKKELVPLKESDKDYRAWKLKIQGGVILWKVLKYCGACGLGAVAYRLIMGGGS